MRRRHAISPAFSGHYQDLDMPSLKEVISCRRAEISVVNTSSHSRGAARRYWRPQIVCLPRFGGGDDFRVRPPLPHSLPPVAWHRQPVPWSLLAWNVFIDTVHPQPGTFPFPVLEFWGKNTIRMSYTGTMAYCRDFPSTTSI